MAADKRHHSTPSERTSAGPSKRELRESLSVETLDAVDDMDHVLRAYRCIEDLLVPITRDAPGVEVTSQRLHALISALNDALAVRINRAKRVAARAKVLTQQMAE